MLSIGLVGCGAVVHSNYAATLIGRAAYGVRYVCDTDAEQAARTAARFDAQVASLERLADEADVVIISTPPSTHAALVRACLRPGRTVLCEKPFMTTHADALAASQAAEGVGANLYVGHFRRTFPQLLLAQDLVSLGVIGDVRSISASEGGRFTWKAVSNYPTTDPNGGVLWDTGSHTLAMALFASGLARSPALNVANVDVQRDKPEPSHAFQATFTLNADDRAPQCRLRVSRKEVLPNMVRLQGTRGELGFLTDMDDRVRLTTPAGSVILYAERSYDDLMECLDVELQQILLHAGDAPFLAARFVGQINILETLSNAS